MQNSQKIIQRILILLLLAAFPASPGCSHNSALKSNNSQDGRTRGIYLEMQVTDTKARIVDITLDYDGNLMVIAGKQVITSETGYSAILSVEEISQLTKMFESAGWFKDNIKSDSTNNDNDDTRFKINLYHPDGHSKFTIYAKTGPVFDIYNMLMEIALRKKYQETLIETAVRSQN